jgi:Family of unknown function (DUF6444)
MGLLSEPANPVWSFPFTPQDWEQTPRAVQAYVRTLRDEVAQLHDHVETLEARLTQNSTTTSRPPSSDSPFKKPRRHTTATTPRKAGGKPGHPGHRQVLAPPHHRARGEACAVCMWEHNICCDHSVPYVPGDRVARDCDGGDALGFTSELVSSVWGLDAGTRPSRACQWLWSPLQCPRWGVGRDLW